MHAARRSCKIYNIEESNSTQTASTKRLMDRPQNKDERFARFVDARSLVVLRLIQRAWCALAPGREVQLQRVCWIQRAVVAGRPLPSAIEDYSGCKQIRIGTLHNLSRRIPTICCFCDVSPARRRAFEFNLRSFIVTLDHKWSAVRNRLGFWSRNSDQSPFASAAHN